MGSRKSSATGTRMICSADTGRDSERRYCSTTVEGDRIVEQSVGLGDRARMLSLLRRRRYHANNNPINSIGWN